MKHPPIFPTVPATWKPASQQANAIFHLTNYFFIVAALMLLLVCILTVFILFKYCGKEGDPEPAPTRSSKTLELLMVGVPVILVSVFFFLTVKTMNRVLPTAEGHTPDVIITGHQWWWEVYYPASKATAANEVHLPAGRRLLLELRSADVIHDWWVPELGNKMDMVPGMNNYLWLDIDTRGLYNGACSEFCGQQHAWMRIQVVAQPEAEYERWLAAQAQVSSGINDAAVASGRHIFESKTCGNCHRIAGTIALGTVGPDLTHIGSRSTLLTGISDNTEENLFQWLKQPQEVKPGAHMPRFIMDDTSLHAMAAYLTALK